GGCGRSGTGGLAVYALRRRAARQATVVRRRGASRAGQGAVRMFCGAHPRQRIALRNRPFSGDDGRRAGEQRASHHSAGFEEDVLRPLFRVRVAARGRVCAAVLLLLLLLLLFDLLLYLLLLLPLLFLFADGRFLAGSFARRRHHLEIRRPEPPRFLRASRLNRLIAGLP